MTDREIVRDEDVERIDFAKAGGLVPVVVQDVATNELLMLAYQDREALEATRADGRMHFRSRSREELWMKGETSGNTLEVVSLHADCDGDAVLARVRPTGPTCHTGERSCFGEVTRRGARDPGAVLPRLDATIASRAAERPANSYTVRLLDDANLRLKKLGEESAELVAALATGDRERAVAEAADLVYHVLVALSAASVRATDLLAELESRAG